MTTKLITPPSALAVSLSTVKENLRVYTSDDDSLITLWIEGVTSHAEHYLGRSLISQTWQETLDSFPDAIKLTNVPVASVSFVKYYDLDNVIQTLDPSDYVLDNVSEPSYIVPSISVSWPETYDKINAVQVQYVAGYGATSADVPKQIQLYLLAKLTEQFDPNVRAEKDTVQSSYIDRLLDRFKVYG